MHEFLQVKTAYKDWFPRMVEYGFTEGEDFCSILSESTGGRLSTDHQITIIASPCHDRLLFTFALDAGIYQRGHLVA